MALQIFGFNGWDTTTLRRRFTYTASGSYPLIDATAGPRGGRCLRQSQQAATYIGLSAATATVTLGCYVYFEALPSSGSGDFFTLMSSSDYQLAARVNPSGTITIARRTNLISYTALGTTTGEVPLGGWVHLGFVITIDNSVGSCDVYFNGVVDLSLTNQDTQGASGSTADTILFGLGGFTAAIWRLADVYITSGTTFLGIAKVTGYLPTGAGTYTGLTPSAGSNYQCVDDATPDDDTTTVYGTSGKDTYTHGALDHVPNAILGVKIECIAKDEDAAGHTLAPYIISNVTEDAGTGVGLSVGYAVIDEVWETDPDTGVAWTESGFNALEFGQEIA